MIFNARKIPQIIFASVLNLIKHDGVEMAGYLAFLTILSIFPCAIFLTKLISIFHFFINDHIIINPLIEKLNDIKNIQIKKIKY